MANFPWLSVILRTISFFLFFVIFPTYLVKSLELLVRLKFFVREIFGDSVTHTKLQPQGSRMSQILGGASRMHVVHAGSSALYMKLIPCVVDFWKVGKVWQISTHFKSLDALVWNILLYRSCIKFWTHFESERIVPRVPIPFVLFGKVKLYKNRGACMWCCFHCHCLISVVKWQRYPPLSYLWCPVPMWMSLTVDAYLYRFGINNYRRITDTKYF